MSQECARDRTEWPFEVAPLSDVMAAEICGLDLAQGIDDQVRDAIREAFLAYHVLCFRDQHLTGEQLVAFSKRFGPLESHINHEFRGDAIPELHRVSNLGDDGKPTSKLKAKGNFRWHSDKSYLPVPSLATLLHAVELPPDGGATQFANMHAAYDALSADQKAEFEKVRVIHSWEQSRINSGSRPATEQEKRDAPPVVHPLVRTHPETGRKTLYLGDHSSHLEGKPFAEGRAFLAELQEQATQDSVVYHHRWQPGDLIMWDNRSLLHRATADFDLNRHRRVLHRTVIRGSAPV
jgi:taurine dioxygenase